MTVLQLLVLAVVQGITVFLPVSSSAHLVLFSQALCWPNAGLLVGLAVRIGAFLAILIYLWRDVGAMTAGLFQMVRGRRHPGARLFWLSVLATMPAACGWYALARYGLSGSAVWLRGIAVLGWATLGFGIVLHIADRVGMTVRRIEHLRISDAIMVGLAQVLALIPGASRAGVAMTAARFVGMERVDAARFSLILSVPALIGVGAFDGWQLYQSGQAVVTSVALTAAGISFVAALIAVAVMMAWLRRASFLPFVVYRIVLGAALLAIAYGGLGAITC